VRHARGDRRAVVRAEVNPFDLSLLMGQARSIAVPRREGASTGLTRWRRRSPSSPANRLVIPNPSSSARDEVEFSPR
jgi:hypothetical protein